MTLGRRPARDRALLAAAAGVLALTSVGCPDTSLDTAPADAGNAGGSATSGAGKLTLVQTLPAVAAGSFHALRGLAIGPDDAHLYVTSQPGFLATFGRGGDGLLSASPTYTLPFDQGWGLEARALGGQNHLYAVASNPTKVEHYTLDPVSGQTVPDKYLTFDDEVDELAVAAGGAVLVVASAQTSLLSYPIDPSTGGLTLGPILTHQAAGDTFTIFPHPDQPAIFVPRREGPGSYSLVRFAVDPTHGKLTEGPKVSADLVGGLAYLAMCPGTSRLYVPEKGGSIGYADVTGGGLSLGAGFEHPDLAGASSIALSADCRSAYAVAGTAPSRSLVVMARASSGDLSWVQTFPTGPGSDLPGLTAPVYARVAADGKNVYVFSSDGDAAIAVLQRSAGE